MKLADRQKDTSPLCSYFMYFMQGMHGNVKEMHFKWQDECEWGIWTTVKESGDDMSYGIIAAFLEWTMEIHDRFLALSQDC
jgi:hypothetical protein